jgi:hypothetical protein
MFGPPLKSGNAGAVSSDTAPAAAVAGVTPCRRELCSALVAGTGQAFLFLLRRNALQASLMPTGANPVWLELLPRLGLMALRAPAVAG